MENLFGMIDVDRAINLGYSVLNEYDNKNVVVNHKSLRNNDKLDLISIVDFEVVGSGQNLRLKDLQGANLGNIENEKFDCLDSVLKRLDDYLSDYGYCIIWGNDLEKIRK